MQVDSVLTIILYVVLAGQFCALIRVMSKIDIVRPVFSALRVYAIWGANRTFATIVFWLAMGAPIATTVSAIILDDCTKVFNDITYPQYYNTLLTTKSASPPFTGCDQHFNSADSLENTLYVATPLPRYLASF